MKKKSITAAEFDEKFEGNENLNEFLDLENGTRPGQKPRRVSVDFPEWMVQELDKVARNLGITRQSVIKVFISDKLKKTV
ncbi:MAG: CopG family transcriptional regulator [Algoriphagus sp.]|uniref:type II toxin-antitoxin system BrnA family antitoxin n=1 Tax=Algoriphagus sp. TaxID=1872435 RepID=UPI00272F08C1|nr:CopG family transcriptional regulator [Algoriphagus sp.]MDP2042528.1 CopG family transcriptional regulator [Algoriphagus sp.]MDP3471878.1 CopG family transcriptional regulator [Algoriphagus sp.]